MSTERKARRADALRNRTRVLDTAYELFASEGLTVPIDQIAERAGVGAGTVYRHFPTKQALVHAVIEHRLAEVIAHGRALIDGVAAGEAFFSFLDFVAENAGSDHALVEAFAASGDRGIDIAGDANDDFMELLGDLLANAQLDGAVRADIDVTVVKTLLIGQQAMALHGEGSDTSPNVVTAILRAGLAPPR
jgi:AcrR family transcriptional regulator